MHLRIDGKSDKIRFMLVAMHSQRLIHEYLAAARHKNWRDHSFAR
jgi:hypothetical protein